MIAILAVLAAEASVPIGLLALYFVKVKQAPLEYPTDADGRVK